MTTKGRFDMSEEKVLTERELHTNETLAMPVHPDSDLKTYLVEYVGSRLENE